MKIIIGSDHAGYLLKEQIKQHLVANGYQVDDVGCYSEESVDYPVYGFKVATEVAKSEENYGVAVCGSGIGISISANKVKGIRCANVNSVELAQLSREHNNANIVALGARFIDEDLACAIVDTFLKTKFAGGRHEKRVDMLNRGA